MNNELQPIDDELRERILEANAELAGQEQRVLGVRFHVWESAELPSEQERLEAEGVFVGLVAMLRSSAPRS